MSKKSLFDCHLHEAWGFFWGKQFDSCVTSPNLIEEYLFLELKQERLQLFGHVCIDSEPVERHEAIDDAHIEVLTVFSKGKFLGFVCVVEDEAGEAEEGVEVVLVWCNVQKVVSFDVLSHFNQKRQK
jgi:hypothetical protein